MDPLTDNLLDEVADVLVDPMRALSRAVFELVASSRDEFRASFMEDLRREEDSLRAFLTNDDSRDTLAWVLGFARSFVGFFLAIEEPAQLALLDEAAVREALDAKELRPVVRAQVALMAAIKVAKEGADRDRCASLVDSAFLGFMEFRAWLRQHGVLLSPFPNETSGERRESLLRDASRLRERLTDQDWQALDQARMGNLR